MAGRRDCHRFLRAWGTGLTEGFRFCFFDLVSAQVVEDLQAGFYLARYAKEAGGEMSRALFGAPPGTADLPLRYPYGSLGLDRVEQELGAINKELQSLDQRLSVQPPARDEEWRIAGHDATMWSLIHRAFVYNTFTAKEGQKQPDSPIFLVDLAVLLDPEFRRDR